MWPPVCNELSAQLVQYLAGVGGVVELSGKHLGQGDSHTEGHNGGEHVHALAVTVGGLWRGRCACVGSDDVR